MNPTSLDSISERITRIFGLRFALWVALGLWWFSGAFDHLWFSGVHHDWLSFVHKVHIAWKSVVEYSQFPVWNPYNCGGIPALGNAQSMFFSPTFLWVILLGTLPGLKMAALTLLVLGLEGGYQYARFKEIRGAGAIVVATLYAFSGPFAQLWIEGHLPFMGLMLLPWVLLCFEKGLRGSTRWLIGGAFFMAWIFGEGGAITTPMVTIVLLVFALAHSAMHLSSADLQARWYRPFVALLLLGVIALGLSGPRLLTVAETLLLYPREWLGLQSYSVSRILGMLLSKPLGQGYWGPGTAYVGIGGLIGLGLGLWLRDRFAVFLLVIGFFFLALATGDNGLLGIYDALKALPLYENLRAPFRYTFVLAFVLALAAGRGLALWEDRLLKALRTRAIPQLKQRWPKRSGSVTTAALTVSVAISALGAWAMVQDPLTFNRARIQDIFGTPPPLVVNQPFKQSIGNRWNAQIWPFANLGTLACIEAQNFFMAPGLRGDLKQEEYLQDETAGTVQRVSWSPHRIALSATLSRSALLLVNQNRHRAWTTNIGQIVEHQGLLAVRLPAGTHQVTLTFRDPLVTVGVIIALLTMISCVVVFWRLRARAPPV